MIEFVGSPDGYTAAYLNGEYAGFIWVHNNEVIDINVFPQYRRKGVATGLYNHVGRPRHSLWRTNEGNAWAKSVGGEFPDRHYTIERVT